MTELRVPAVLYDEALAFCNARNAEDGRPAITELPPGKPGDASSCPCSRACQRIWVYNHDWFRLEEGQTTITDWTKARREGAPVKFVRYFDDHEPRGSDGYSLNQEVLPIRDETLAVE